MSTPFTLGQEASASEFMKALTALQVQGASVLQTLETDYNELLVDFDRRLSAVNARRILAWRVDSAEQALKFVVSDFSDIDQANTTGTVRADSASVSLKERAVPAEAVIKTNQFSSNIGTIQALDAAQSILSVTTQNGSTPVGQFDIELVTPLTLNQFIIDIVSTPSTPTIIVSVSPDGLTYTQATQIAINGYNVTVWLPSVESRFIRIQITPSHPDTLNGNTYTFGITQFSAQATDYHLRSELLTKTLQFAPKSQYVTLDAPVNPNILYYLSLYPDGDVPAPLVEVNPGELIIIGTAESTPVTTNPSTSSFLLSIPGNVYRNTILVTETISGETVRLRYVDGLSDADSRISYLANEYIILTPTSLGYDLELVGPPRAAAPRTFVVSYVYGPSLVNVQLKVRLSTTDKAVTPIFQGASLDEV